MGSDEVRFGGPAAVVVTEAQNVRLAQAPTAMDHGPVGFDFLSGGPRFELIRKQDIRLLRSIRNQLSRGPMTTALLTTMSR